MLNTLMAEPLAAEHMKDIQLLSHTYCWYCVWRCSLTRIHRCFFVMTAQYLAVQFKRSETVRTRPRIDRQLIVTPGTVVLDTNVNKPQHSCHVLSHVG